VEDNNLFVGLSVYDLCKILKADVIKVIVPAVPSNSDNYDYFCSKLLFNSFSNG